MSLPSVTRECIFTLVDDFNGSFLGHFEIDLKIQLVIICLEYFCETSFVYHEDGLFNICRTNWGWSELPNERSHKVWVDDGDGGHEHVTLVPLSQHDTVKVKAVVAQTKAQTK